VQPAPQDRAPQSWSPAAREEWTKTPPNVRAQITKREKEIATALQESAGDRRTAHSASARRSRRTSTCSAGADPIPVVKSFFHDRAPARVRASLAAGSRIRRRRTS
jgi:hypothetical protein